MLHALPFTTFGEAVALGLEAHVYCPSCYTTRQLDPAGDRLRHRCFAGTRFRCTNMRWTGAICGGHPLPRVAVFQQGCACVGVVRGFCPSASLGSSYPIVGGAAG